MNKILDEVINKINEADAVLIGAGSGLSTAAGIKYAGDEFKKEFAPFISKYGFTDLYSSSFYEFDTYEEYWAYFAKHINYANTGRSATKLYEKIYDLIKEKEYFVITTNVDDQFFKSGFDKNRIFRVQGSYALNQCEVACHEKLYQNKEIVDKMLKSIDKDLRVDSSILPYCPVCSGKMVPNLRKDEYFVEDDLWHKQSDSYREFLKSNKDKKLLMLEFGVGFNTPGIIRYPFEQMAHENDKWTLIRFNKEKQTYYDLNGRFIGITEDIEKVII